MRAYWSLSHVVIIGCICIKHDSAKWFQQYKRCTTYSILSVFATIAKVQLMFHFVEDHRKIHLLGYNLSNSFIPSKIHHERIKFDFKMASKLCLFIWNRLNLHICQILFYTNFSSLKNVLLNLILFSKKINFCIWMKGM